jgi:hypothetical protein
MHALLRNHHHLIFLSLIVKDRVTVGRQGYVLTTAVIDATANIRCYALYNFLTICARILMVYFTVVLMERTLILW